MAPGSLGILEVLIFYFFKKKKQNTLFSPHFKAWKRLLCLHNWLGFSDGIIARPKVTSSLYVQIYFKDIHRLWAVFWTLSQTLYAVTLFTVIKWQFKSRRLLQYDRFFDIKQNNLNLCKIRNLYTFWNN